ncbi:TIGR00266 family protein [Methylosinus sp. 3S-1]|nr:TIGR00266 family protein [Methylosinus sp. 3S-1]
MIWQASSSQCDREEADMSSGEGGFLGGGGIWGAYPSVPSVAPGANRSPAEALRFEIKGHEMQFVEIELDPGRACVAEAGAMMFKEAAVGMETIFGDGAQEDSGLLGKLWRGAKRALSGSTLFMTRFTNNGYSPARAAFAAPYPGKILPLRLDLLGGELLCQRDTFLAGAPGVAIDIAFQKKIMTGLFGGEGFIMQRLSGNGIVFVHAGGAVVERELAPGEELHVDSGCLVAQTATVSFDVVPVGGVKSMFFGGEGFFFARLVGPGHVWLQSMPFSRLVGHIASRMPSSGGGVGVSWPVGGGSESGSGGGGWGGGGDNSEA